MKKSVLPETRFTSPNAVRGGVSGLYEGWGLGQSASGGGGSGGLCGGRTAHFRLSSSQVVKAFDGGVDAALLSHGDEGKARALKESVRRQQCWLKRRASDQQLVTWRPSKRFRTSAKQWLYAVDNQLKSSLPCRGLSDFVKSENSWAIWKDYRHLLISADQGSDGLSAIAYLRSLGAVLTFCPDFSHGSQNDFYDALKSMHLFPFWILMLVVYNLEHGPWQGDLRWNQINESWAEVFSHFGGGDFPLLDQRVESISRESGGRSALLEGDHEDVHRAIWAKVAHMSLKGKLIHQPEGEHERSTTSSSRTCAVERMLRNSAQNAVVLSVLMLGERWHQLLVRAIVKASEPIHLWHRRQNHAHRSAQDSVQWCAEQLSGWFGQTVRQILAQLSDAGALEFVGFSFGSALNHHPSAGEVLEADELAAVFGGLSLALAGRRWARCLFMLRGWPFRLVAVLGGDELRSDTIAEFRQDYLAYRALMDAPGKTAAMTALLRRSCFGDIAVEQWVQALVVVGVAFGVPTWCSERSGAALHIMLGFLRPADPGVSAYYLQDLLRLSASCATVMARASLALLS